jgi:hypothetical protein
MKWLFQNEWSCGRLRIENYFFESLGRPFILTVEQLLARACYGLGLAWKNVV